MLDLNCHHIIDVILLQELACIGLRVKEADSAAAMELRKAGQAKPRASTIKSIELPIHHQLMTRVRAVFVYRLDASLELAISL